MTIIKISLKLLIGIMALLFCESCQTTPSYEFVTLTAEENISQFPSVPSTVTPTQTQHIKTQTITATTVPSKTLTPTVTNSPTASTPSPTLTWTPLATIDEAELATYLLNLFQDHEDCRLPCWWGITPGVTQWRDAKRFLERFAEISGDVSPFDDSILVQFVKIPVPEDIFHIPLTHTYIVRNNIVDTIKIYLGNAPTSTLSNTLNTYGQPNEIWISTYSTEYPPGVLPFILILFYSDQNFLVINGPEVAYFSGNSVRGCKLDGPSSMYGLWSQDRKMTFEEVAYEFGLNITEPGFLVLPIQEATGMNINTFFEIFKEPGSTTCIDTPRELWPEQQ